MTLSWIIFHMKNGVKYLTGLLKEQGVTEGLLLDLGCGTGSLTELRGRWL